jgi:hypothetical protein
MRTLVGSVILVALLAAVSTTAQQAVPAKPEESFYRLDFVLRELEDGKVINTRSYSLWLSSVVEGSRGGRGGGGSIRAGNDMPAVSTAQGDKPAGVTYKNTGISIDCTLTESASGPVMSMSGSIVNVVTPDQGQDNKMLLPVFRSINLNAYTLLALGKPTLISSVDDPGSKRRFQLEVTGTKLR